ncbi:Protein Mono-Adp-Ribosyltransferase Tiparp [Manis pentadactyla]|nr:Protein Mono-Adp-Ribosyltransferase Tiparp [Manis pentadactyla]
MHASEASCMQMGHEELEAEDSRGCTNTDMHTNEGTKPTIRGDMGIAQRLFYEARNNIFEMEMLTVVHVADCCKARVLGRQQPPRDFQCFMKIALNYGPVKKIHEQMFRGIRCSLVEDSCRFPSQADLDYAIDRLELGLIYHTIVKKNT